MSIRFSLSTEHGRSWCAAEMQDNIPLIKTKQNETGNPSRVLFLMKFGQRARHHSGLSGIVYGRFREPQFPYRSGSGEFGWISAPPDVCHPSGTQICRRAVPKAMPRRRKGVGSIGLEIRTHETAPLRDTSEAASSVSKLCKPFHLSPPFGNISLWETRFAIVNSLSSDAEIMLTESGSACIERSSPDKSP